ncbi:amino acid permease [Periweissella fabaria]|uniref:Transport protein YifK n=1 Tax=Periweissella fabaria TaxID=546157 RepID=A0ABM8Z5N6_9LACO|nr:amino acid permease [Periweissella fabaria]MCM0598081.1 amino acid permease [Periweissella fabaria]CAH0416699.1 putative transport protein YifK [Periweissella fabaria]
MAEKHLKRELSPRHMQMIALGGTIGVGLFMGAAATIKWTGPSVLLAYAFAGMLLYLVMRALGEMLYVNPTTGSFVNYANEYIHPLAGYLTAWSNIFQWLVVSISEVIAVGAYLHYWWPNFPTWTAGIVVIVSLAAANLVSVKAFGEMEFWFASIKVFTIIAMIILGLLVILLGLGNHWHPIGFSNLWSHGGFFTGGFKGFFFALSIIVASYQGIEIIGLTAGEAKDPKTAVVKSIHSIVFRILIFYIGAIFVIVTIYPWNQLSALGSPFVQTFAKIGITFAAGLINFVMLTAAMSGCNSGIFSSSRMLYTLGLDNEISKKFTKVSRFNVPYVAVIVMALGMVIGLVLNELSPMFLHSNKNVFVVVYSSSVLPGMVPWFVILLSDLKFRRANPELMKQHPFKMPLFPFTNYFALFVLVVILGFMLINPETQISVIVGIFVLSGLAVIYGLKQVFKNSKKHRVGSVLESKN